MHRKAQQAIYPMPIAVLIWWALRAQYVNEAMVEETCYPTIKLNQISRQSETDMPFAEAAIFSVISFSSLSSMISGS